MSSGTRILGVNLGEHEQVFWGPEVDASDQRVFGAAIFNSKEGHYVRRFGENQDEVITSLKREPEFRRDSLHIVTHQFSEWVSALLNRCHQNPKSMQELSGKSLDRYTHEVGRTWRILGQRVCEERSRLYSLTKFLSPQAQIDQAIEEMRREIIQPLRRENTVLRRRIAQLEAHPLRKENEALIARNAELEELLAKKKKRA